MIVLRKFFTAIRVIISGFYRQYIILPVGLVYCLCKLHKKGVTYVVVCDHIGDTIFSLGYLRAFREKHAIKKLAFVTTGHLMQLADLYSDDIDYKIAISKTWLHFILQGQQTPIGFLAYKHMMKRVVIVEPANHVVSGFNFICGFPNVYFIDLIRYGIFRLDETGGYKLPALDRKPDIEKNTVRQNAGRKVILTPHAQVMEKIPEEYFEIIVRELRRRGFDIYTNITGKADKVLRGTKGFSCDLLELFKMVREEKICFIGLRSGLLDLVQHAGGCVMALYPENTGLEHFFEMGQGILDSSSVAQYTITGDAGKDTKEILDKFMQIV